MSHRGPPSQGCWVLFLEPPGQDGLPRILWLPTGDSFVDDKQPHTQGSSWCNVIGPSVVGEPRRKWGGIFPRQGQKGPRPVAGQPTPPQFQLMWIWRRSLPGAFRKLLG